MSLLASVVAWDDMLEVMWVSFAAGLGATVVFAWGLLGATRFLDFRRDGRMAEATVYGLLAVVAGGGIAALVVLAIVVMMAK